MLVARRVIGPFAEYLRELGVLYMGLCCGNRAFYTRSMAEALGRKPPASQYSPDMTKHFSTFKDDTHKHATDAFNTNLSSGKK